MQEKWTKESAIKLFLYFYNQNKDLFFIAYDEDKPVGIITSVLKPWWDGYHLEDGELFVIPEYRHQGIAKLLFKALFKCAVDKYNVTVLEAHTYEDENGFPYNWYKRIGFETVNDLKIISGNIKEIMKKL
ncbi:MAG: GNAT family N-acetyltransferase [Alphaproteobacteria bacterium]|nr:GNAT family N-acetyltransferase [Alphaproteobacteria bacterium]